MKTSIFLLPYKVFGLALLLDDKELPNPTLSLQFEGFSTN